MNYFPFHVGDYTARTAHLEPLEDLAYRRCLDLYYLREGALPAQPAEVARLIRLRANAVEVEAVLREFFVLSADGWVQGRCDKEIAKFQAMAAGGKAGAAKRWAKGGDSPPISPPIAPPIDTPLPTNNQEPVPNNQEPRTRQEQKNSVPVGTAPAKAGADTEQGESARKKAPITDPAEIIFGYGVPLLTAAGSSDKHARSFLGGLRKSHGDGPLIDKLRECLRAKPLQPLEWLGAALPPPASASTSERAEEAKKLEDARSTAAAKQMVFGKKKLETIDV